MKKFSVFLVTIALCFASTGASAWWQSVQQSNAGWTPMTPAGLVAWYKADNDSTNVFGNTACTTPVTTAVNVDCWVDKSGHGYNLVGISSFPVYNLTGMAGFPEVCFTSASSHFLRAATGVAMGTGNLFTSFIQFQPTASSPAFMIAATYAPPSSNSTSTGAVDFLHENNTTATYNGTQYITTVTSTSVAIANNTPAAFGLRADGSNLISYLNGTGQTPVASTASNFISGGCISVGNGATTGASTCTGNGTALSGCISEIVIYNTALSTADIASMTAYLAARW